MTRYCRPSRPRNVIGVALPLAGRSALHNSLPVAVSNARIFRSIVAARNVSPDAVEIGPPRLGMIAVSHFFVPVARSIATRAAGGLGVHGTPGGTKRILRRMMYGVP